MSQTMFTDPRNVFPFFANPMMFMPMPLFSPLPMMFPPPGAAGPAQFAPFGGAPQPTPEMRKAFLQSQKQQLLQLQEYMASYAKSIEEALASIEAEIAATEKEKTK